MDPPPPQRQCTWKLTYTLLDKVLDLKSTCGSRFITTAPLDAIGKVRESGLFLALLLTSHVILGKSITSVSITIKRRDLSYLNLNYPFQFYHVILFRLPGFFFFFMKSNLVLTSERPEITVSLQSIKVRQQLILGSV